MTPWSPCPRCKHSMAVHRETDAGWRCQVFVAPKRGWRGDTSRKTAQTCRCKRRPGVPA